MTASLLQLVSVGNEDYYLIGNPQFSYFKTVYKRYSNFSIERIQNLNLNSRQLNHNQENEFIFNIDTKYGDLLGSLYFQLQLPDIYCYYPYKFRWIKNIGEMIINEAIIFVDSKILDRIDNHLIQIFNTDELNCDSLDKYNELIGNEKYYFENDTLQEFNFSQQNLDDNFNIPNIKKKNLIIKIPFYFVRNKLQKLPLLKLRQNNIQIKLTLKPLNDLYLIGNICSVKLGKYNYIYDELDKNTYNIINYYKFSKVINQNNNNNLSILDLVKNSYFQNINLSLIYYVYFIDNSEKKYLLNNNINLLVERNLKYSFLGLSVFSQNRFYVNSNIKEVILVPQRNDTYLRNTWSNYSTLDDDIDFDINQYTNKYLKLSFKQLKKDLQFIEKIDNKYKDYTNQLSLYQNVSIIIKYSISDVIYTENYNGPINATGPYQKYIKTLQVSKNIDISPFTYYGKFLIIDDESDLNTDTSYVLFEKDYFKLKLINNNYSSFENNIFKYLPSISVVEDTIIIDYNNPIYTESIIENNFNLYENDFVTINNIRYILNTWNLRDYKTIPYITSNNFSYFKYKNIISNFNLKILNEFITNNISDEYTQLGEFYNNFNNNIVKNIIRLSTEVTDDNYGSTFLKVDNNQLSLLLKVKDIENDIRITTINNTEYEYKFNVYMYVISYLDIIIKNNTIMF